MSFAPDHSTVWIEIPVSDLVKSSAFYAKITGLTLIEMDMGPNKTSVFQTKAPGTGVAGHLYEGKSSGDGTGSTIHLACEGKLEDTVQRVWDAGGRVISDAIEIPSGRFAYCLDLDGNSIGIFEPAS